MPQGYDLERRDQRKKDCDEGGFPWARYLASRGRVRKEWGNMVFERRGPRVRRSDRVQECCVQTAQFGWQAVGLPIHEATESVTWSDERRWLWDGRWAEYRKFIKGEAH